MAPATSSGKTVWDAELRSELLMAVIRHAPPSSEQWALIIDEMQAKGHTFNANAAMQHLAKLRKKSPNAGGGDKAPAASASGGTTKTKKPRAPAKTGGKRKFKKNDADSDGNEDDEETAAPAAKKRGRKPKAEAKPQADHIEMSSVPSYTDWQTVPPDMNMTPEEYNALAPNPFLNDEA